MLCMEVQCIFKLKNILSVEPSRKQWNYTKYSEKIRTPDNRDSV